MMTRHLLRAPGSLPIEFDVSSGESTAESCGCCGEVRRSTGDLLHREDCVVAREAVARQHRDITTDGAADFVEELKLDFARAFADETLGTQEGHVDSPAEAARRADLVAGHVAGYRKAEAAARAFVRRCLARMSAELDTWDGALPEDGDGT